MSLDLSQVATQIAQMTGQIRDGAARRRGQHDEAVQQLRAWDGQWEDLKARLANVQRDHLIWRPPLLHDGLIGGFPAAACPTEYTVIAVDGSHIEPDRHRSVDCYLVNVGQVVIQYGPGASASLSNEPKVQLSHVITDESQSASDGDEQEEIDRAAITAERTLLEMKTLADLATAHTTDPTLALIDGSLLWNLGRYLRPSSGPGSRENRLLGQYAEQLRRIRQLATGRRLVLAGYVSYPGSHEVDDALRIAVCPDDRRVNDLPNCMAKCPIARIPPNQRPCSSVGDVFDRDLFDAALQVGQRSAVFMTDERQLPKQIDDEDLPCFYYLRTAAEIVRVEIPRWVVDDPEFLALSHALTLDQADRGQGYPAALMEADALAAVTTGDRLRFWEMDERQMAEGRIGMTTSAKSRSKRLRWI